MQPQSEREPLEVWIAARIRTGGPVTFAQFMSWALYHPRHGYYTKGPDIGPRGDFVTSPEASPAFGWLLAHHLREIDDLLEHPARFDTIECGPGRGTLASDLLDTLKREAPALYGRLRYWLVDVSPALVSAQQEKLLPEHATLVQWRNVVREIPAGAQGAVIANELVDAFPVHIVENHEGVLLEQGVGLDAEGKLTPVYLPLVDARLAVFLREQSLILEPGESIEVNLAAGEWLEQLSAHFQKGVVTIIDYGDKAPERYSPARREGTLLGYYEGSVTDDVLAHPGNQDLTALVDFTALERDARRAGFDVLAITRQANFLIGLGLGTTVTPESATSSVEATLQYRRGLQALVSMEGLGRFHVMLLAKNVDPHRAAGLSGLKHVTLGARPSASS